MAAPGNLQDLLFGFGINRSPQFQKLKSSFDLDQDRDIRGFMDPETGTLKRVPKDQRVGFKKFKNNPYGVTPGNAIDPDVSFFDDILNQANQEFGTNQELFKRMRGA